MPSLEAIGSSSQTGSVRAGDIPVVRPVEPESEQPVDKGERAESRPQTQRVELPSRAFQARLNYDNNAEEVIVEILDPNTGDVLQRLPAEELPDDHLF
ncbi:MAG: hypothetical protein OER92_09940, partial [Alphaproteobacteria bacterium]|nr:hypothetical protein [Alphaproteobacteria bacterium]